MSILLGCRKGLIATAIVVGLPLMACHAFAATCDLKNTEQSLLDGLAAAHATAEVGQEVPLYSDDQVYCDARLTDVLQSYADAADPAVVKKRAFLDAIPEEKRAAVEAAVEAELAKP